MKPAPEIVTCPPERREAALALLFAELPEETRTEHVARLLAEGSRAQESLAALRVILQPGLSQTHGPSDPGEVAGAIWAPIDAGRVATLFCPSVAPHHPADWCVRLASDALHECGRRGASLALVVLEPESRLAPPAWLSPCGFQWLADLEYLAASLDAEIDLCEEGGVPPAFEIHANGQDARLIDILERTYLHTLDCPGLEGLRHPADTLAGYRRTGVHVPEWWQIVRHGGRDVGCLLLADLPDEDRAELVYMGLSPEVRGRGWGNRLVRRAKELARRAGRRYLVLAVDARNEPAVRAYRREGFAAWQMRSVYIRRLGP